MGNDYDHKDQYYLPLQVPVRAYVTFENEDAYNKALELSEAFLKMK